MRLTQARLFGAAARALCISSACVIAGCSTEMVSTADSPNAAVVSAQAAPVVEPRIEPIPPIPLPLQGCWVADEPDDPEEPHGSDRLLITGTTIEQTAEDVPRRVATAEYVTRVAPTSIEGLFSAPGEQGRITIATALMLGDDVDYGPVGHLRRAEGDAGSSFYSRCTD